jgi:hypothetical protein
MIPPEVPARLAVRQAVFNDQPDGHVNNLGGVLGIWQNEVIEIVMKVVMAIFTTMLGVNEMDVPRLLPNWISELVKNSLVFPDSRGLGLAFRARPGFETPTFPDNFRGWKIAWALDFLVEIWGILTNGEHMDLPSEILSKG